jgi:hypothetical protein
VAIFALKQNILLHFFIVNLFFFLYESVPVLYMHVYMKNEEGYKSYFRSELNCAKKAIFTSKWAFKSNLVFHFIFEKSAKNSFVDSFF